MLYIEDGQISDCKKIELDGKIIFNPTAEQIAAAGWQVYVTPPLTNDDIRRLREENYKMRSDSLYMAFVKYTEQGETEKAEAAKIAWLEEIAQIDAEYPYLPEQ